MFFTACIFGVLCYVNDIVGAPLAKKKTFLQSAKFAESHNDIFHVEKCLRQEKPGNATGFYTFFVYFARPFEDHITPCLSDSLLR